MKQAASKAFTFIGLHGVMHWMIKLFISYLPYHTDGTMDVTIVTNVVRNTDSLKEQYIHL
jgi:hypothetical protein